MLKKKFTHVIQPGTGRHGTYGRNRFCIEGSKISLIDGVAHAEIIAMNDQASSTKKIVRPWAHFDENLTLMS